MTTNGFRRIALGMKDVIESAHMDHPDFRVDGRIFATLGYPDARWGMVQLTPEQQDEAVRDHDAFTPAKGAWGAKGSTMVKLSAIDEETLGAALTMAWQNARSRPAAKRTAAKRAAAGSPRKRAGPRR